MAPNFFFQEKFRENLGAFRAQPMDDVVIGAQSEECISTGADTIRMSVNVIIINYYITNYVMK